MSASRAHRTPVRRDLFAITCDGIGFTVMVGLGERAFQQFGLALGHDQVSVGLLATVPMVAGAALQLAASRMVAVIGSLKRVVVLTATLQALSFVPLFFAARAGALSVGGLFALATLYHMGGIAGAPAWTAWMETIVPASIRERFFGRRAAWCQAGLFGALVVAGIVLRSASEDGRTLAAFASLFAAAGAARLVSVFFLARQSEPVRLPEGHVHVGVAEIVRRLRAGSPLRSLFGYLPFLAAAHFAQSYFVPWSRRELGFADDRVLWLTAAEFAGRMAALPAFGMMVRGRGPRPVLLIGALGLVPIPALWAVRQEFEWLLVVQVVSGVAWAAFELGGFFLFFQTTEPRERTSILAAHFFAWSVFISAGSVLGGAALSALAPIGLGRSADYVVVFMASSLLRLVCLRWLRRGDCVIL